MNIAYYVEMYRHNPHGGIAIWTKRLKDYYETLGIQSRVYSYSDGIAGEIPEFVKLFPNVRELLAYPYLGKKSIPEISGEHDLIHFASPLSLAWYKAEIPTIVTTHYIISRQADCLGKYLPTKYKLFFNPVTYRTFQHSEKKGFQNADHITVCRPAFKEYLMQNMGLAEERITIVRNGVDHQKFQPAPETQFKQPVALFVGRGSLPKGFDTFLKSACMINGKLIAVLPREPDKALLDQARNLKNVELKISLSEDEMVRIYQQASVFVMPSLSEGAPLSTLEAMASGLPVVCTPEGSGDYIVDDYSGYIFNFKNAGQLAEKVNYLFDHPDLMVEFGKRNRQRIENELTLPIIADKILKIYKKLC
ncbi:glycosyltransferase [candidate division KSB1 bacterium]|nr:glycosyltransferase [candidate division KSB1 bacterium]